MSTKPPMHGWRWDALCAAVCIVLFLAFVAVVEVAS